MRCCERDRTPVVSSISVGKIANTKWCRNSTEMSDLNNFFKKKDSVFSGLKYWEITRVQCYSQVLFAEE